MNISIKLIIFHTISLYFLCIPKMINSLDCCKTTLTCAGLEIKFPFRLKDRKPESSCGSHGFDLYCDNEEGLLFLDLPKAGNFTVVTIHYSLRKIQLSDTNNCLPKKLSALDLTTTRFEIDSESNEYYHVYNCTGGSDNYSPYGDVIGCLSGKDYTIIRARIYSSVIHSNCRLLFGRFLQSYYSTIYLDWDQPTCKNGDESDPGQVAAYVLATLLAGLIIVCGCYFWCTRLSRRNNEQPTFTMTYTNHTVSHGHGQSSTPYSNVHGLDQITISSYPVVVIGRSSRLIKEGDDTCPICLSDYIPGDTLKILPDCLHRFHVDCIDLWLSTKPTCPVCRTPPPHNS